MAEPLDIRSSDGANSARLADTAVSQWQAIDSALAPIIGTLGVAALYHRSLFLSQKTHAWLDQERSPDVPDMDLPALRALLTSRDVAEVSEASATLLRTFMELLASLVGASLAERLLGPLWTQSAADSAAQDTSS